MSGYGEQRKGWWRGGQITVSLVVLLLTNQETKITYRGKKSRFDSREWIGTFDL